MAVNHTGSWEYPGARWWKFDFHTHTPASEDYQTKGVTPRDWLLEFMRAEIDCVAVTDHNSGEWIDNLKATLRELEKEQHPEFRRLYLFPGVEITANGGIHVLAILDPSKATADINSLLGSVQYRDQRGASKRAADTPVIEVANQISQAGGIAIPAHVDGRKGLWELAGNTLEPVLTSGHIFAIEVMDVSLEKPELYRQHQLAWAEVLGSDSHALPNADKPKHPGSHYTWIKMEEPSIVGLRMALLDGERFSVQRSDDAGRPPPDSLPDHYIRSVKIDQARMMGRGNAAAELEFSPWFNVLIGGRGTGKSTVLHCLRLAAQREAELKSLDEHSISRTTFERFNRVSHTRSDDGGLREETHIIWTLSRHGVAHRVHWQTQAEDRAIIVEDQSGDGSWIKSSAQNVSEDRFPIRLFSQGQIAELAGDNQAALLDLIDEGAKSDSVKQELAAKRHDFLTTRARIRDAAAKLARRDHLSVELADIQRKLAAFEDSGHAETLRAHHRGQRQRRELARHFEIAQEAAKQVDDLASQMQPEDIVDNIFDETGDGGGGAVAAIEATHRAMEDAASQLRQVAEKLRSAVNNQRLELSHSAWQRQFDDIGDDYNTIAESFGADTIDDPTQHPFLIQKHQRLIGEQEKLNSLEQDRKLLERQAADELAALAQTRRALSDTRVAFLKEALERNEFVRIQLVPYGDNLRAAEQSLREALNIDSDSFATEIGGSEDTTSDSGIIDKLLAGLPVEFGPRQDELENRLKKCRSTFEHACKGKGAFGVRFNKNLEGKHKHSPEFLDRLLTWFPPDSLHVEHRLTGDTADFGPIGQASAGQRAAAMLAFLLAHGEEPLVLDQPEDDLDNQLIYSLIVKQIKENKLRRQIIAVTHNPNIVVNGDAEMVHVLDFRAGQCRVAQSGSLQGVEMREQVCRIMEGGRDALERRYRRLDNGSSDV